MSSVMREHCSSAPGGNPLSLSTLIKGLHSLHDGPAYVNQLIVYGPAAIPILSDLLLNGTPSGVPQPRQWTVEALAGLGAYDVLLSYLRRPLRISDPIVRHGEEAVQNTAARELAACQTDEVFAVLLDRLRTRALPGIVETIGLHCRPEAVPYLIDCLEDDMCRTAAMEALQRFGDAIRPVLVESAVTKIPPSSILESPSSIRRRRGCLRLLEPLGITAEEVSRLAPLLNENDPDVVISAAKILLHASHFKDYRSIWCQLNRVRQTLGWWLQDEFRVLISQLEGRLHSDANTDRL